MPLSKNDYIITKNMLYRDIWLEILPFIFQNELLLLLGYHSYINNYINSFNYSRFNHIESYVSSKQLVNILNNVESKNIKYIDISLILKRRITETTHIISIINQGWKLELYQFLSGNNINNMRLMIKKMDQNMHNILLHSIYTLYSHGCHISIFKIINRKDPKYFSWNNIFGNICLRSGFLYIFQKYNNRKLLKYIAKNICDNDRSCTSCLRNIDEHISDLITFNQHHYPKRKYFKP